MKQEPIRLTTLHENGKDQVISAIKTYYDLSEDVCCGKKTDEFSAIYKLLELKSKQVESPINIAHRSLISQIQKEFPAVKTKAINQTFPNTKYIAKLDLLTIAISMWKVILKSSLVY